MAIDGDFIDSLHVTSEGDAITIDTDLGKLQMYTTVFPSDPTENSVSWSVDYDTVATIDENTGVLTAVNEWYTKPHPGCLPEPSHHHCSLSPAIIV